MAEELNRKDCKLTTLAIVGGGIAGRSLLYEFSKGNISFDEILLFESETLAPSCSLQSTAISALRGVTKGHSPLGDLIWESFDIFRQHVSDEAPEGVHPIQLYSGAIEKLEQFRKRYPAGYERQNLGQLNLSSSIYFAQEDAFMIDPPVYLEWLFNQAAKKIKIKHIREFVTEISGDGRICIQTQLKNKYEADHIVMATGAHTSSWSQFFSETKLKSSRFVQGAYLEFDSVDFKQASFAMSIEGCTLVYHAHSQKLLIGSASQEVSHSLPDWRELERIYSFFESKLDLALPPFEKGRPKVGHREKSRKREPYFFTEGNVSFMGGLYKNGFTLSLKISQALCGQLRERG